MSPKLYIYITKRYAIMFTTFLSALFRNCYLNEPCYSHRLKQSKIGVAKITRKETWQWHQCVSGDDAQANLGYITSHHQEVCKQTQCNWWSNVTCTTKYTSFMAGELNMKCYKCKMEVNTDKDRIYIHSAINKVNMQCRMI